MYVIMYFDCCMNTFCYQLFESVVLHRNHICLYLNDLVTEYNNTLGNILDKHAPMLTKTIISRPQVPWFTDQLRIEKRKKRKAETRWLTTKYVHNYDKYKTARNKTLHAMNNARRMYYTEIIKENSHDQKSLFKGEVQ